MASVDTPFPASLVPKVRALARWGIMLLPVALAVAIVTWWPRSSSPRPASTATLISKSNQAATQAQTLASSKEDSEERRLAEAIDRARISTVALEYNPGEPSGKRKVATGVVISDGGDVISVRVEPPAGLARDSIVARDSVGHEHPARWMAADPETGLTLLKVQDNDIRPIRPTARAVLLGATVFLIGHPYDLGQSVSLGNVAGLNRRVKYGPRPLGGLIQVQVSLHPGDSGALLADRKGGWLGLIRGGGLTPDGKDDNNLGFAIPALDALWVADQLLAHRKVDRAFLGIKFVKDSAEIGAELIDVVRGAPAEKAGLRGGDRIVRLDDRPIRTPDDLTDRLDRIAAGSRVTLDYYRGAALAQATVETTVRPVDKPQTPSVEPPQAPVPPSTTATPPTP